MKAARIAALRCLTCGDWRRPHVRLGDACGTCDEPRLEGHVFPACDVCGGEGMGDRPDANGVVIFDDCLACNGLGVRCCQDCGEPTDATATGSTLPDGRTLPPEARCDDCRAEREFRRLMPWVARSVGE